MYALDAADGNLIWKFQADGRINHSPAVHKGSLFVTDSTGNLHVLSARTGQERLLYRAPGSSTRSPVVDHGLVYFLSGGIMYAVDANARRIPLEFQLKKVWAQFGYGRSLEFPALRASEAGGGASPRRILKKGLPLRQR